MQLEPRRLVRTSAGVAHNLKLNVNCPRTKALSHESRVSNWGAHYPGFFLWRAHTRRLGEKDDDFSFRLFFQRQKAEGQSSSSRQARQFPPARPARGRTPKSRRPLPPPSGKPGAATRRPASQSKPPATHPAWKPSLLPVAPSPRSLSS